MREYALTLAQPALSAGLIPNLAQCFRTVLLRRKIRKALLSDDKCPVTGLAGDDLRHLLTLPKSCDLTMEIERIKFLAALNQQNQGSVAEQSTIMPMIEVKLSSTTCERRLKAQTA